MQLGRGTAKPPIGIAFEGDFGQRIDAVLAVAMLNGLSTKGEARNIALCVSATDIKAAQLADVLAGFYTGRPVGGVAMVGMPEFGPPGTGGPVLAALNTKGPDGGPLYTSNISRVLDTADNAVLIRNMLLAQVDGNAAIVVAGPLTGIARLLGLYGAKPQIAAKVKHLVIAAGRMGSGAADPAIAADVAAAKAVFADWPTPIIVVGAEVGEALPYPGAAIDQDLKWSPAHPVADAYRATKAMPYDAPASALAALALAAHPDDGSFKLSDPGTVTIGADGRMQFAPAADGKRRYAMVDPAQQDRVIKLYRDMVAAQPAPRGGGRGRGAPPVGQPPVGQPPAGQAPAGRGAPPPAAPGGAPPAAAPSPATPATPNATPR